MRNRANPENCRALNRKYLATPKGKAARARATIAYRARNRERQTAHDAVAYALRTGLIQRWPCEVCGNDKAQAHHPHYGVPLLVTWLCDAHHKAAHQLIAQTAQSEPPPLNRP